MAGHPIVLLLFIATSVTLITAQSALPKCCRSITKTRPPQSELKRFYKQHSYPCPLEVVVFVTKKMQEYVQTQKSVDKKQHEIPEQKTK
ncbi:hypothetical protein WMY93_001500 [Mugilogobius chulae]|uniref:Chemokine interleukin-8-like domain-containing protein n=1 Tax=Mugilogobius chulae TaxID=88201 RepID=A0AAW0Q504_9GOBI